MGSTEIEKNVEEKVEGPEDKVEKIDSLLSQGRKLLISGNKDAAIDALSDAARLASLHYGELAVEMYPIYINYGRALLEYTNDMVVLLNQKNDDESESSSEDEEDKEEDDDSVDGVKDDADKGNDDDDKVEEELNNDDNAKVVKDDNIKEGNGDGPIVDGEVDDLMVADDEQLDDLSDMIKSSWDILELARNVSEKRLESVSDADEVKEWRLRMAEAKFYLAQVLILDEEFDRAKEELSSALDVKKELLPEDHRELSEVYFQLGRVNNLREDFEESVTNFKDAKDILSKRIAYLENQIKTVDDTEGKMLKDEVVDLVDLCKEMEMAITDAKESIGGAELFKMKIMEETGLRLPLNTAADDISSLVRKRPKPESNGSDEKNGCGPAKKSKEDA